MSSNMVDITIGCDKKEIYFRSPLEWTVKEWIGDKATAYSSALSWFMDLRVCAKTNGHRLPLL